MAKIPYAAAPNQGEVSLLGGASGVSEKPTRPTNSVGNIQAQRGTKRPSGKRAKSRTSPSHDRSRSISPKKPSRPGRGTCSMLTEANVMSQREAKRLMRLGDVRQKINTPSPR